MPLQISAKYRPLVLHPDPDARLDGLLQLIGTLSSSKFLDYGISLLADS